LAFEIDDGAGDYMSDLGPALLGFFRDRNILLRPLGNTMGIIYETRQNSLPTTSI